MSIICESDSISAGGCFQCHVLECGVNSTPIHRKAIRARRRNYLACPIKDNWCTRWHRCDSACGSRRIWSATLKLKCDAEAGAVDALKRVIGMLERRRWIARGAFAGAVAARVADIIRGVAGQCRAR